MPLLRNRKSSALCGLTVNTRMAGVFNLSSVTTLALVAVSAGLTSLPLASAWHPTMPWISFPARQASFSSSSNPTRRVSGLHQSSSAAGRGINNRQRNPRLVEELTGCFVDGSPVSLRSQQQSNGGEAKNDSTTTLTQTQQEQEQDESALKFRYAFHDLTLAAVVGIVAGLMIALFKFSIEWVRQGFYAQPISEYNPILIAVIPALGGLVVGLLTLMGQFSPGLRGTVEQVDQDAATLNQTQRMSITKIMRRQWDSLRKTVAAVFTLGSGCSLGPEGPCVEIGMSVARACMDATTPDSFVGTARRRQGWNRRLLACGAASGVAAGFNAPVAGVFFALEVMGNTFAAVTNDNNHKSAEETNSVDESTALVDYASSFRLKELSATERISPILVSSVCAALAAKALLGEHFVLQLSAYSLKNPLLELPLYMLLGIISGGVAFTFSEGAKLSQGFFAGKVGSNGMKKFMRKVPNWTKPLVGGIFCGLVGLAFPQILFFGYETLNGLLAKSSLPIALILSLLVVKILTTAVSAGSGLIGGTFAPALYLGAMTGAAFHSGFSFLLDTVLASKVAFLPGMADLPAYTMIGSASVLAALFRAPLTASMVLFELTRDYDVILPLMVSAGLGSLVGDILDNKFEQAKRRRDTDSVSWGDLASKETDEDEDREIVFNGASGTTSSPSEGSNEGGVLE